MSKLKKKKKSKKQKNIITLRTDKGTYVGKLFFGQFGDWFLATSEPGQEMKTDFITISKRTVLQNILVSPEGKPIIHAAVTLDQLQRFMKQLKKDLPKLCKINKKHKFPVLGLRHLAPDLSFVVLK